MLQIMIIHTTKFKIAFQSQFILSYKYLFFKLNIKKGFY